MVFFPVYVWHKPWQKAPWASIAPATTTGVSALADRDILPEKKELSPI